MSAKAREQAREHGQQSGKGNQTMSRLLSALGVAGVAAYVLGRSGQNDDEQTE